MAGYSGTPLGKKLGIKPGFRVLVVHAPDDYRELLAPIPEGVQFVPRNDETTDLTHLFVTSAQILEERLTTLRQSMRSDAMVWVSWPKKSAKVATDVTEDVIRAIALPMGFVDVKVCAVDATWSGLKLVIRVNQRSR